MTSESYLTPPEAARFLRISTSTLSKFRVYGGGPTFTRAGRAIRYPLTSLDSFMAAHLVGSTSEQPNQTGLAAADTTRIRHTK